MDGFVELDLLVRVTTAAVLVYGKIARSAALSHVALQARVVPCLIPGIISSYRHISTAVLIVLVEEVLYRVSEAQAMVFISRERTLRDHTPNQQGNRPYQVVSGSINS